MISPQLTPHRAPWFWWNLPASPTSATSGSRGWWCSSWWACRWCGGGGAGWAARPPRTSLTPPPSYLHCPAERFWWHGYHWHLWDLYCVHCTLVAGMNHIGGQKKKSHLEKLLLQLSTELLHWRPNQENMQSDLLFKPLPLDVYTYFVPPENGLIRQKCTFITAVWLGRVQDWIAAP